jgi:hypothetical protein
MYHLHDRVIRGTASPLHACVGYRTEEYVMSFTTHVPSFIIVTYKDGPYRP